MSYFNFTSDIDSTYIDNITPLYDNKILKLFRVHKNILNAFMQWLILENNCIKHKISHFCAFN